MEERWYKLDNAAKIYPAIREANWSSVFRLSVVLKKEINCEILQEALRMTYKRFPTFSVHIARGVFWYYFEPNESEPKALQEDTYPMRPFAEEGDRGYLYRVLYYKKRISLEVFHSISDGYGALTFLKTLTFNYLSLINGQQLVSDTRELDKYGILYYKDLPNSEETEDSFQYYSLPNEKLDLKEGPAFKIPGTRVGKNEIRLTHVLINLRALIRLAKDFNATITEFLTALLIQSILKARIYGGAEKLPIRISVPVNLRSRFPSKTMRNFSSYVNVQMYPDRQQGDVDLRDICKLVKDQIREGTNIDSLRKKFSGNVNSEKSIAIRVAPLFIKNLVLRTVFFMVGERITTTTLSNVGNVILPEKMMEEVERFDAVLGPPKQNAVNCAVMSFGETLSLSITSLITENTITKALVDYLVEKGIEVRLETNY